MATNRIGVWRGWWQKSSNRMDGNSGRWPKTVLLAWVLWSQLVGFTRPDGQPEQVWLRLQLFQSAEECRESLSRFMTYELSEAVKVERQRGSRVTRYPDGTEFLTPLWVLMRSISNACPTARTHAGRRPSEPGRGKALMRAFAWSCVLVGILLAVAAFVITANTSLNPWPTLVAGFCLTAIGVIVLTIRRDL